MKMDSKIVKSTSKYLTIQTTIPIEGKDMLTHEEAIQMAMNEAGVIATQYILSQYDTDGSPVKVGKEKYTGKGQVSKIYQCPFGEFELCRHVYQSNQGGSTYCPLENDDRIIAGSTPKFAKTVSSQYSRNSAGDVQRDLRENHGRSVSSTYIQQISRAVGDVASEHQNWQYLPTVEKEKVATIGISIDGTCMLLRNDGWRQAMAGSISFYDARGERLNSIYVAQVPEYGKESFCNMLNKEISQVKKKYPDKTFVGVADGAADNRLFLQPFVEEQILDFFHASEYLSKVSKAVHKTGATASQWLENACHTLKHESNGAKILLGEMRNFLKKKITDNKKEEISKAITYFTNHLHQMNYAKYTSKNMPIGSGVIEAACKVIIKQRMCNSGMKWTDTGAKTVLLLRCFNETDGKWQQFWDKVMRYGNNIK
jgi:hypothetical protein